MSSTPKHNNRLIPTILIIGLVIAVLSYLFHPDVGEFSLFINGEPIAEPLGRFAAIPTALAVMFVAGALSVLIFLGVGVVLFFGTLFFAMLGIALIAPFLSPLLVVIFLIIVLMAFSSSNSD